MALTDQARIAADRDTVRIAALWQALVALKSTVSFMNTGAHPDDETSEMLAAMRFRDGVDISYACFHARRGWPERYRSGKRGGPWDAAHSRDGGRL